MTLLAALAALLLVPTAGETGQQQRQRPGPARVGRAGVSRTRRDAWKAAKQAAKAERRAARAETSDDAEPKHQTPAWICKFEREQDAEGLRGEVRHQRQQGERIREVRLPGGPGPRRARHR